MLPKHNYVFKRLPIGTFKNQYLKTGDLYPTGSTCLNDFANPVDQDIRTQCALSWKKVVSEWRSVIAVSLNVGGGVCLIKPAKLYMCMQRHYKHRGRTHGPGCVHPKFRGALLQELDYSNDY